MKIFVLRLCPRDLTFLLVPLLEITQTFLIVPMT
jgi:hypothetical protein